MRGVKDRTGVDDWQWQRVASVSCYVVGGILVSLAVLEIRRVNAISGDDVVLFILGCGFIGGGVGLSKASGTVTLSRKVAAMSPLVGRDQNEVCGELGSAQEVETTDVGDTLMTWISPGYEITVVFRDGVCTRIAREKTKRID